MQNFNGIIDEVRILDRALTAEEIAAIYANESVKYRNTFTYANNTNMMLTLGWAKEQNTTSFDPSSNTLGFSGEVLECYSNDTEVLVRHEITIEELKELQSWKMEDKKASKNKRAFQEAKKSKEENYLQEIEQELIKLWGELESKT